MKRGSTAFLCAGLLVVLLGGVARAHGGLEASAPEEGARLKKPPKRVEMDFSEVPAQDSVVKVLDGCKRNVVASAEVVGNELVAVIDDAQPGEWTASYRVISAEDGHLTKGSLHFTVDGAKDCTPEDGQGRGPGGDPSDAPGGGTATPPGDDGSDFPVVPVAVGAAGLVILGFVVRRVSAG